MKIHLITNVHGLPIKAEISPGQCSDYTDYDLLQDEDLPDPKVFIADRGYDANAIREDVEGKGGIAIIPGRGTMENFVPWRFDYAIGKRSSNIMANWLFTEFHSRTERFHSTEVAFRAR